MKIKIMLLVLGFLAAPINAQAIITYSMEPLFDYKSLSPGIGTAYLNNGYVAWTGQDCGREPTDCQYQVYYYDRENKYRITNYANPDYNLGEGKIPIQDFSFSSGKISWKINEVYSTFYIPNYAPMSVPDSDFISYIANNGYMNELFIDDGKEIINLTDVNEKVFIDRYGREAFDIYPDYVISYAQSGNYLLMAYGNTRVYEGPVGPQIAWFDYDQKHLYLDDYPASNTYGTVYNIQVWGNYAIYENSDPVLYFMTYNKPSASTIPEPSTWLLLGTGLAGAFFQWKYKARI